MIKSTDREAWRRRVFAATPRMSAFIAGPHDTFLCGSGTLALRAPADLHIYLENRQASGGHAPRVTWRWLRTWAKRNVDGGGPCDPEHPAHQAWACARRLLLAGAWGV